MMTLGFYFNLTQTSNCAKLCSEGKIRTVVLNFIKKFQFPNPRTMESFNEAVNDNISVAPLRIILHILYFMKMQAPDDAYLTREEIANFIFYNSEIAKTHTPNDGFEDVLNHNVYGIHIMNKNDALSEEHPHVCIGWSNLGDLTNVDS